MVETHFWLKHSDENNKKLNSGIDIAFLKLTSERIDWNRQGLIGRPGTGQYPKNCNSN